MSVIPGLPWYLASHWTSGGQVPKAFFLIMILVTYGLIALLGIGAYRLLRGGPAGTGGGDEGPGGRVGGRDGSAGRSG
ncbi:hypothetical protein Tmar_0409 [Thermaerobacter marianensis DSM 12885]|uniref:Uncharacterized protein n=1 Tax=Thermaerobacter marianensis (strain ATCC 700841 / DSM 12885 / JCM 10246 / 7p75a) TaxID=644966 RepID=E6SGI4_THEM7|nr:hypothetical protein [Thermaerobacter marianensis]ADU50530.1 hypothetical protein Tmar_0409 [Thermaerobacter marianensis DSM 12885]